MRLRGHQAPPVESLVTVELLPNAEIDDLVEQLVHELPGAEITRRGAFVDVTIGGPFPLAHAVIMIESKYAARGGER